MKNIILFVVFFWLSACFRAQAQDALNLPLSERQAFYNKANLIPNPSFEEDRGLSHWTVVGKDVVLTGAAGARAAAGANDDAGAHGAADPHDLADPHGGRHAVKITRAANEVSEVDGGSAGSSEGGSEGGSAGILSDLIEVIPGNYNFHFDIRLENIYPAVQRFQSRIGNGIDIHLEYFDADKKRINPGYYFEYLGKEVDNGFKGFAFTNFFYIDSFAWGRVKGRSWNYPYSEGDLPPNCKYVRIFAGLACSGTMWIDNLDFRLSKWDFTPEERVDSFFAREYSPSQLLIPTPQLVENERSIPLGKVGIAYAGKSSPETNAALALLRSRFHTTDKTGKGGLQIILLLGAVQAKDQGAAQVAPEWSQPFHAILNKSQGYFIRRKDKHIYIGANTPQGLYYAATTICQLIDDKRKLLDYADITDYPDFTGRSSVLVGYQNEWTMDQDKSLTDSAKTARLAERAANLQQQLRDIDFYAFYKINLFYDNYFQDSRRWWLPGDFYKTYYKAIGEGCARYGQLLNTAVMVNPYYHIPMEQSVDTLSDSLVRIFAHGTPDGFDKILNVISPALDAGAKTVMLCADDYVPHLGKPRGEYTLFNPVDEAQFTNLANAQNELLNKLKAWLDAAYGNIRLEFVPPQYNNFFADYTRGMAEAYFHDLMNHLDPAIVIVWTGNTIRSMSYDAADIARFTGFIDRKPKVWDNSPYARLVERPNGGYPINYPAKSVLCNLFEPFDIEYPDDFASHLDSSFYSNLGGFGETAKIKYLTFADFSWNNKDYNPDFSLYKALVRYVGRDNGRLLLRFNAAYFQLVALWGALKMEKAHDVGYRCTAVEVRQGAEVIDRMTAAINALKEMKNKALVGQIADVMKTKVNDWNGMIR
jgi:hypothetical protein